VISSYVYIGIMLYIITLVVNASVPAFGDKDSTNAKISITYVPSHLHHMVFELLKVICFIWNSVLKFRVNSVLPIMKIVCSPDDTMIYPDIDGNCASNQSIAVSSQLILFVTLFLVCCNTCFTWNISDFHICCHTLNFAFDLLRLPFLQSIPLVLTTIKLIHTILIFL